ncbi:MAG TPA: N-acetylglucosamine-6-phosphate deacetylase [Firmicutes bacterium]|nr:N-acetylglucosamine-6-phosphate deacetylase [Bacillota bacterium]HHY99042.1 N-acetylglucosamine-6-phosphate deacetylase [Bacillota bacterium]
MAEKPICLINTVAITPERLIKDGAIWIDGGKIQYVGATDEVGRQLGLNNIESNIGPGDKVEIIDCHGLYAAPGFIDMHVHGGGGVDLMDGTADAILTMAASHARFGTTALVPTTLTSSMEDLFETLDNMKKACRLQPGKDYPGARILGVHLEGPYFSLEMCGAQDPRYIKNPVAEEYMRILDYSDNIVRVSAAPELPNALDLGRELRRRGILASIGHSDAIFDQVLEAVESGYSHVTHLYSGMSTVRRIDAFRYAGVVEAALLIDELTVEVIADGKHLPASLLQLAYKCKGPDRLALVTDAMRAAGMPEGVYILGSLKDGQKVVVEDGVAKLPDRSAFAGSVATTDRLVRTMVEMAEIPLRDAITMMTSTPARILGISDRKGKIAVGMDADIVLFDENINVKMTMVEGNMVHICDEIERGRTLCATRCS